MIHRFPLVSLAALALLAAAPGCQLFGEIACDSDDDCPDGVRFCVEGTCAKDDDGRDGRGVDGCTADSDCPQGICSDGSDPFAEAGACLPDLALDPDCSDDADVRAPARDDGGPVVFGLTATDKGDGCFGLAFTYFDREGDAPGFVELVVQGSNLTQSQTVDGSTVTVDFACGAQFEHKSGVIVSDANNKLSNTLCVPPPG